MIRFANEHFAGPNVAFQTADLEHLDFTDGGFDLVISNSVLHWLNQPGLGLRVDAAFAQLGRVLRSGGLIALSVAGVGTGRRFNRAYRETMQELQLAELDKLIEDPIGCMQLHDVVDALLRNGLELLTAGMEYEPITFASAADYANAVRAYGISRCSPRTHRSSGRKQRGRRSCSASRKTILAGRIDMIST